MPRDDSHISDFNKNAGVSGGNLDAPVDEQGRTLLHISIEKGSRVDTEKLLLAHVNVNLPDKMGQTPLYAAITARDPEMAGLLIARGATFKTEDKQGRTPVIWAIEQGCDAEFLDTLHKMGCDFDQKSKADVTALHAAAAANRADIAEYLVEKGADIEAADVNGQTALHVAVEKKAHAAMEKLLSLGADPLVRTSKIKTPLHLAAETGDQAAADILLAIPAVRQSIDGFKSYDDGYTPLLAAVNGNHLEMAKKLLDAGADPNQRDNKNRNSLFVSAVGGHPEILKLLIQNGADPEKGARFTFDQAPAILWISDNHYQEILHILYMAGTDLDAKNAQGKTALHCAAEYMEKPKLEALLNLGANPSVADELGRRPLDMLIEQSYYKEDPDLVRLFLNRGAQTGISPLPLVMYAPLHAAARLGHIETVRLLLAYNADINEPARDASGSTPLLHAILFGRYDTMEVLLKGGANPLQTDRLGQNALHVAAQGRSREILAELLKVEDLARLIDAQDQNGKTPLHIAAESGAHEILEVLIRHGANPWVHDKDGMTAVHYAAMSDRAEALAAFQKVIGHQYNWNVRTRDSGETPLHAAARKGLPARIEQLLVLGSDVAAFGAHGFAPLHIAILEQQNAAVHALVKDMKMKKVDVDLRCKANQWTPLHYAATLQTPVSAAFLLLSGADINARTAEGNTPLHIAARTGQQQVADFLMSKGADASLKNADGKTPLDLAREQNHEHMVSAMVKAAATKADKAKSPKGPAL